MRKSYNPKTLTFFTILSAAALLPVVASALTLSETGDAGQLIGSAQLATGPAGTVLDNILGSNGFAGDIDMYGFFIPDTTVFSDEVVFFDGPQGDSQLFLFDEAGSLVSENDDGGVGLFSAIGSFTGSAGNYFLAFSDYDNDPIGNPLTGWNNNYILPDIGNYNIVLTGAESTSPVPEPATMLLFGAGLAGLAAAGRRRKQ